MNQITYTRDQLDAQIALIEPSLPGLSTYGTLRDQALAVVMGEYNAEMIEADDEFVRADNFASPLSSGATPAIDTSVYDLFSVALPAGVHSIVGDTIWVEVAPGTFLEATRGKVADVSLGTTVLAFETNNGQIALVEKDATFTAPADMLFYYYRILTDTLVTGSDTLDIRAEDFNSIAQRVAAYMLSA